MSKHTALGMLVFAALAASDAAYAAEKAKEAAKAPLPAPKVTPGRCWPEGTIVPKDTSTTTACPDYDLNTRVRQA